jgi:hypothetical protein
MRETGSPSDGPDDAMPPIAVQQPGVAIRGKQIAFVADAWAHPARYLGGLVLIA